VCLAALGEAFANGRLTRGPELRTAGTMTAGARLRQAKAVWQAGPLRTRPPADQT